MRFSAPRLLSAAVFMLAPLLLAGCHRNEHDLRNAQTLEHNNKWEAALLAYEHLLPRVKPGDKATLAEVDARIGHCLLELHRGTDAMMALNKAVALDSSNTEAHLRLAQLYIAADMNERARPHLDFVAIARPADPELPELLGAMYAAEDKPQQAEAEFLRAYEASGSSEEVAERLAQLYLNTGRPAQAVAILSRASVESGDRVHALLALARVEETEGLADAAEKHYRAAISLDDSPENNRRLAQFYARSGEMAKAETVLRHVDALRPAAPVAMADFDLETRHTDRALSEYRSAYSRFIVPQPSAKISGAVLDEKRRLAARMIEAEIAAARPGNDAAFAALKQHLSGLSAVLDSETRSLLETEVGLAVGDLPSAEHAARQVLEADANSAPAEYLLGEIAARAGHASDAHNYWQSALNIQSDYVPARLSLASEALENGDAAAAEEYAVNVVREEPANLDAVLLYGRSLLLQKQYNSARELGKRASAAAPEDSAPAIFLGDIDLAERHLALALLEYEKAMLLDPQSEAAMEGLAKVYEAGPVTAAVVRKLETLAVSGTPSSRMLEIAGRLYATLHMNDDAARCLRRAVAMDPHRTSAAVALAELDTDKQHPSGAAPEESLMAAALPGTRHSALLAAFRAEQNNDQAATIRDYEAAIRAGDPSGTASNNLAWIFASEGRDLDRALSLAQHALELNPGSPQVFDTIGMVQMQRRKFSEAISAFRSGAQRAAELDPHGGLRRAIEAHLASATAQLGQPAAAPPESK
jgi:tetratricopeptide (TPR) repeat protein